MPVRAVLFDAAGTLIEPAEPVGESYARIAAQSGVVLPARRLEEAFHRVLRRAPPLSTAQATLSEIREREHAWWRELVRQTFRACDGAALFADFDTCFGALWRHFSRGAAWRARPGAAAGIDSLRRSGCRIGIASNFDHRLPEILQDLDLFDLFDSVTLPSTCGERKPEARFFEAARAGIGARAAEIAFVGDDAVSDLAGARAAGLRAYDVADWPDLAVLAAHLRAAATLPPGRSAQ